MEDVFQKSFQCLEIDLEYEYDASRFFDFTRPESLAEAQGAELWFETAASYPPSPLIAKLNLREDVVIKNSNVFSKPNDVEHSNPITTYSEIDMEPRFFVPKENGGDALYAFRRALKDPENFLQSWDPTLVNPCTWFHVTCDGDNRVTRLDLGNAGLSGTLVPELGRLEKL